MKYMSAKFNLINKNQGLERLKETQNDLRKQRDMHSKILNSYLIEKILNENTFETLKLVIIFLKLYFYINKITNMTRKEIFN